MKSTQNLKQYSIISHADRFIFFSIDSMTQEVAARLQLLRERGQPVRVVSKTSHDVRRHS